jgi:peptidoglycan/LPS O-acetylase OafA/YrhL
VLAFLLGRSSIGGELIFWLSGVLIAIVLTGIVAEQSTWLVRVLEFPPVRYIGVISYGVYIYHSVIILPFGPEVLSSKARTVIEIVASIGVAAFSWHFIEHPLLDLRDNLRQRRSPVLASGA